MNELDQRILEALNTEDRKILEKYQEPSFMVQIGQSFSGKLGPIMVVTWALTIPIAIMLFVSGYFFFTSADEQTTRLSMVGFICAFMASGFTKTFYYTHLGHLNLMREIKRLELQISLMTEHTAK